ncbi:hypothetical protein BJX96DRAFT_180596 [Aspergillus floccosus]
MFLQSVQNTVFRLSQANAQGEYRKDNVELLSEAWRHVVDLELEVLMKADTFSSLVSRSIIAIDQLRAVQDRRPTLLRRFWAKIYRIKKDRHDERLQRELEVLIKKLVARNELFVELNEEGFLRWKAGQAIKWNERCMDSRKGRIDGDGVNVYNAESRTYETARD